MAAQDELFQLIKSLTPSEKRYFKVNGDSKSNYMQLFDAMDKQKEEYDEELLKKKNAKKPFVKYLSAEKKQLREQIMKHMRAYRADSTIDNKINELLQDEAFYRDKGLKALREKAIAKAKELATKYERFHLLQEILEKEIMLVEEFEEKSLTKPVQELLKELRLLSERQQAFISLWSMNKEIFSSYRSGMDTKDVKFREKTNRVINEVEKYKSHLPESFRLANQFHRAFSNYHNIFRDYRKSYDATLAEYNLYQEHSQFKSENPFAYKICLANLIARAQLAKRTDDFLRYTQELRSLPITSFNEEGEVFQNVFFLEHLHYINSGEFDKAMAMVPEIEEGLQRYANKINRARVITFQYNIMIMYFIMHKFKDALRWAEKILNDRSEIKQDVTTTTHILYPILHYEIGHHDLIENLTRSAYRRLKNKDRLHRFERELINYLRAMPFSPNPIEFKRHLEKFSLTIKKLNQTENLQNLYGAEEINLWINYHLHGKSMQQQLKESNSLV